MEMHTVRVWGLKSRDLTARHQIKHRCQNTCFEASLFFTSTTSGVNSHSAVSNNLAFIPNPVFFQNRLLSAFYRYLADNVQYATFKFITMMKIITNDR